VDTAPASFGSPCSPSAVDDERVNLVMFKSASERLATAAELGSVELIFVKAAIRDGYNSNRLSTVFSLDAKYANYFFSVKRYLSLIISKYFP